MPRKKITATKSPVKLKSMPRVLPDAHMPAVVTSEQVTRSAQELPKILPATPDNMLMVAIQSGRGIEEITKFMDLYERWENKREEARKEYAFLDAKSKFQLANKAVTKTKEADFKETNSGKQGAKYKFSPLGNTADDVREALHGNGFTYDWIPSQQGKEISVTCELSHKEGWKKRVTLKMDESDKSGNKSGVQALGSTLTYLQRRTLELVVGIVLKDEDNDGADTTPSHQGSDRPRPTVDEFNEAVQRVRTGKVSAADVEQYYTLTGEQQKTLDLMRPKDVSDLVNNPPFA